MRDERARDEARGEMRKGEIAAMKMEDEGKPVFFLFQSLSNILSNMGHMTTMIEASKH